MPILIAAGVAVWALRPNNTKVPDLTGAKVFAAQQKLEAAGLKLGAQQPEETGSAPAGTILNTIPAAGTSVKKGKEVIVLVAVGTGKVKVPQLIGLTFQAADARLKKRGLQVGRADPPFDDPATAIVDHQTPDPGSEVAKGTGVDITIDPATATTATTTDTTPTTDTATSGTAATTGGGGTTTGGATGAPAVMPALAGLAAGAAINKLGSGVKTTQSQTYSNSVPAGSVIGVDPPAGTKLQPGQKATLLVSLGPAPPIAFGRNGQIFVMNDQGKLRGQPLGTSGASDEEPAWNATGNLLAYVQRNPADNTSSIWVVDPAKPQTARQLTGDGFVDKRPAFSPNGRVIAFVRASAKSPDDLRLCFKRVSSTGKIPVCVRDPALGVARPAWAPDGHAISVILQKDPKDAGQTEVGLFTSAVANSPVVANWNWRGPITDDMHGHASGEGSPSTPRGRRTARRSR